MTYDEAIKYLESLAGFGMKPGLQRITKLLKLLDNPQNKYKTIHVTGTNGKGSVCALISQIIYEARIKVGLYTSPHLVSYCERIKIDNIDISEKDFADLVELMKHTIQTMLDDGDEHPTLFEVLTAMAFTHFANQNVEYAVIEVGLGGLLDSTNVIIPKLCIITNVANDHADRCGGSLRGIAMHKAGIIKPGVPVVTAATGKALKIIQDTADMAGSKCLVYDDSKDKELLKLSLPGLYQTQNGIVVMLSMLELRDYRINQRAILTGIKHFKWPGRFELFNVNGKQVLIDGAHNGAGAEALRMSIDREFSKGRRVFLFGVLKDKDIDKMIYNLFRKKDFVIVTKPDSERAAAPADVCEMLKAKSIESVAVDDVDEAFEMFINEDAKILIAAGSLYLIGHIREKIINRLQ